MKTLHRIIHRLFAALSFVALTGAVAWAEEAAPPPGDGSQIPPTDWGLQIWTLVTFVILLVLLAKFAFKPIAEALDRRGETIKKSIDDAEKSRVDAKKLMEDYQKQIAEAMKQLTQAAGEQGQRLPPVSAKTPPSAVMGRDSGGLYSTSNW